MSHSISKSHHQNLHLDHSYKQCHQYNQMLHHRSLRRARALPIGIAVLEPQHSIRIRDGHDDDRTTTTTGFPTMVADAALVSLLHGLAWTKLDARIPARCGAPW